MDPNSFTATLEVCVMAMPRKIKIDSNETYPYGLFLVSDVSALRNFDKSTADVPVQAVDEETGSGSGRSKLWTRIRKPGSRNGTSR
jgi:hypothetical protein